MPLDIPSLTRPLRAAVPVAILTADARLAAEIEAKLAGTDLWWVAEPSRAAVLIWDPPALLAGELPILPFDEQAEPPPIIALVDETTDPMPLLAAGVRGLVRRGGDIGRLHAAIHAVRLGLSVLDEDPADAIVAAWSPSEVHRSSDRLTPREHEVLELLADGLSNRSIGEALGISAHTVKFHVDALLDKLAARSRTHVVAKAVREGLLELERVH